MLQYYSNYLIKAQNNKMNNEFVLQNFQTYMNSTEDLVNLSVEIAFKNLDDTQH